jgi:hypothetical protein
VPLEIRPPSHLGIHEVPAAVDEAVLHSEINT